MYLGEKVSAIINENEDRCSSMSLYNFLCYLQKLKVDRPFDNPNGVTVYENKYGFLLDGVFYLNDKFIDEMS